MSKNKVLITTAIDYANDVIHIGHAYEKILADFFVRYFRNKLGAENVFFVTGTDEHGTTNEKAAKAKGITTKEHVDEVSKKDQEQIDALNVSYDRFIRTTDEDHQQVAKDFFQKVLDNGDIYKASYEGLYCEGCESYKTLSELTEDGKCPLHPTREIQKYTEENYFFKWSKYGEFLKELVSSDGFVFPEGKKKEMLAFIENGIQDIPVTRPVFKLPWGIESPMDHSQVIYVWFDALINYFTFGSQNGVWDSDTNIIHFVGKDIARWHVLLWPAMLKSAGYDVPTTVYVHGFLNLNGQKISKSLGNVIRPLDLINDFGSDAIRYYFLKNGPVTEDVDISVDHLKEVYNADLANGLGNAAARVSRLAEKSGLEFPVKEMENSLWESSMFEPAKEFRVDLIIQNIWDRISALDKHINDNEPWAIKEPEKLKEVLQYEIDELRIISKIAEPILPETSKKLVEHFSNEKINFLEPLFPRIK